MVDHCTVHVDGVKLAYRVAGPEDAPPLVLLPALGETAGDWEPVASLLALHRRVYALDLRGHGRSDWPGEYAVDRMRADVRGFLDGLGLHRVDLIGHSLGGIVAYLVAADRPARVHRLVLEDVPVPRPREPTHPTRPDGDLSFDWQMVLDVRRQLDRPDPRWGRRLDRITAETLVVAGGPRSHVPQDGVAELARRIPGGRLVTIPVGHLIHRGAPAQFTEAVERFLTADDAGATDDRPVPAARRTRTGRP
ncbi:alpha/beta fold hydrolase [Streptomyces sp. NPDC005955]|uniref:alpha/beta fold hydrolase n=1 Tax=Streptomyces sp. NPDC005955 TaxID=3364738 RepID=UPI003686B696